MSASRATPSPGSPWRRQFCHCLFCLPAGFLSVPLSILLWGLTIILGGLLEHVASLSTTLGWLPCLAQVWTEQGMNLPLPASPLASVILSPMVSWASWELSLC